MLMHLHVLCVGHCAHDTRMLDIVPAAEAYPTLGLKASPNLEEINAFRQQTAASPARLRGVGLPALGVTEELQTDKIQCKTQSCGSLPLLYLTKHVS